MGGEGTWTLKRLAEITGISRVTLMRRSKKENWPATVITGRGGQRYEYATSALPEDIRVMATAHELRQKAAIPGSPEHFGAQAARSYLEDLEQEKEERRKAKIDGLARFAQLPEARKREAEAKYEILAAAKSFIEAGGFKRSRGVNLFCEQYNKGSIELPDWVLEAAEKDGKLHRATFYRWQQKYEAQGLAGLAGNYGHNKGTSKLTKEQQDLIRALICDNPNIQIPKIMAVFAARFNGGSPSVGVVAYWVKQYRRKEQSLLLFMENPDEWRSKCQFAAGSASANIVRLNQLWEADSTPGDIMLAEGRHTVIGIIDVFSRRPRVLVTPTSKAQAVCTLLRRCLMEWGIAETLRTDNGQDYTARHMERVLDALEIDHETTRPFTPEEKPHIERFFRTFSHGIVEMLPGYVGHSVAERKAIENRRSFAERLMKRGGLAEVKLTARQFQAICDRWIDSVYMHNAHEGLDGMTPAEKVRSCTEPVKKIADERSLDVLLCPAAKDGGWRIVGKKGVEADRRTYFNTALAGWERKRVRVLLDYSDRGKAFVFSEAGEFVCMATDPDWYGISAAEEASELKHTQRKIVTAKRKEAKELIREHRVNQAPEDILRYRESLLENVAELPKQTVAYTTDALEEALRAADERDGVKNREALAGPLPLSPEVIACEAEQKKIVDIREKRRERSNFADNREIYFFILDRIKGAEATDIQMQWKREYEAWQDGGMRRPFATTITVAELLGLETGRECRDEL